ncbi:MAG: MBL fold metallo-hydrolase [Deltaproteobacteria bacterium]|nr:MBL fold metallo-hydrolase [Deltaproteobacteria bacterium]
MEVFDTLHAFLWLNPAANNCNTYLINGKKRVLIDPGHYHLFGRVRDELARLSLSPDEIDVVLITHAHPDHLEAVRVFKDAPAVIGAHVREMEFLKEMGAHYGESSFEPDFLLQEGDLRIGDMDFQILHTPGHSPGSLCLYWPGKKALFTGDVVFDQGVGRTDLPGGNGEELKNSIRRISRLDVEYLLPGHGGMVSGRELVQANFDQIERIWFAYL